MIARSHPCPQCREYSFKRLSVEPAPDSHKAELKTLWVVRRLWRWRPRRGTRPGRKRRTHLWRLNCAAAAVP
jgi:hypothetical protein